MEGTGSYGGGLATHLTARGVSLVEVNRPNRATRRARGKSDPIDAEAAARAALAGVATAVPKAHTGVVEAIRVLFVARRGAVQARTAAINTLHQMIITAPIQLRDQLQPLTRRQQIAACARFHAKDLTDPGRATRLALRRLARRIAHLNTEIDDAERDLTGLVADLTPQLLAEVGVGPLSAAQLLITVGDNPNRMTGPAGFAALCGTTPIPVSSGKTNRHRLNRGGDRQANCALHTIVLSRLRYHPETRAYAAKRNAEGKTELDIRRSLKRYLAPPPVRAHPQPHRDRGQHSRRRLTTIGASQPRIKGPFLLPSTSMPMTSPTPPGTSYKSTSLITVAIRSGRTKVLPQRGGGSIPTAGLPSLVPSRGPSSYGASS